MRSIPLWFFLASASARSAAAQVAEEAFAERSLTLAAPVEQSRTTTDCGTWSLTVLGTTFASAGSCVSSRTTRVEDTWTCGPAQGAVRCFARGHQVEVKRFQLDEPCAVVPSTLPELLAMANAVVACRALPQTDSFKVWSARVAAAPGSASTAVDVGSGRYRVHRGALEELPGSNWPTSRIERFAKIRTLDARELPDALRATVGAHGPLLGVSELEASVTFEFFGVPEHGLVTNSFQVAGTLLADRRFALVDMHAVRDEDGAPSVSVHDSLFDGLRFVFGERGSDSYQVFLSSSADAEATLQYEPQFVWPLLGWLQDPFWIPLVPGAVFASAAAGDRVDVSEEFPELRAFGKTVYSIDVSGTVPHPSSIRSFDVQGRLVGTREYADYKMLLPGVWRPRSITVSRFDSASGAVTLRTTLRIHHARALAADEPADLPPLPRTPGRWLVRLP